MTLKFPAVKNKSSHENLVAENEALKARCRSLVSANRKMESVQDGLHESLSRFQSLVDLAVDAIISIDSSGNIIDWNREAESMFRIAKEDAIGMHITKIMPERFISQHNEGMKRVVKSNPESYRGRLTEIYALRDGEEFPIEMSISKWTSKGAVFFTSIIRDITKRHELEALKNDIERITHHDLKTPLNPIIGYSELLLMSPDKLSDEQIDHIKEINEAGNIMLEMVNRSLDMYKMETGAYVLDPKPVELISIVSRVIKNLNSMILKKKVTIEVRLNERPVHYPVHGNNAFFVTGEELLCYSIFANLIKNAVEASPENERIVVSLDRNDSATISIQNQGFVPKKVRDNFFAKYTTSGKKDGTGLGTYSVRLIARAMYGNIRLESSRKNGTIVKVELPVDRSEDRE